MAVNVHSGGSIGKALIYVAAFVAFVGVALTWVPDWMAVSQAMSARWISVDEDVTRDLSAPDASAAGA